MFRNSDRCDCYLCGQIEGDADRDLIASMLPAVPYQRRIIVENEAFAVIPSLGALTPGHVLFCPRHHVRSFATIAWDRATLVAYRALKAELVQSIEARYGGAVHVFEHGMAASGGHVPCTVDHAHLHFLPVHGPVALFDEESWDIAEASMETLAVRTGGREYLMHESASGISHLRTGAPGSFGSQALRRYFAAILGCEERWDWRTHPNAERADGTYAALSAGR